MLRRNNEADNPRKPVIRRKASKSTRNRQTNLVYGSDGPDAAAREIPLFFAANELVDDAFTLDGGSASMTRSEQAHGMRSVGLLRD
jgi:hypothetical protein